MPGTPPVDCSIRPLASSDDIEALTAMLHRAYAVLGRAGLNYTAVDQDAQTTRDRLRGGHCWVAVVDGAIVGTVLVHDDDPDRPECARRPGMAYLSQFAVEPGLQAHGIGARLMDHAERETRRRGFGQLALDTAEPAEHLVRYYDRRGYRLLGTTRFSGKTYRSVVLAKDLTAP